MSLVSLSHYLNSSTPGFGGEKSFSVESVSRISAGKSSNSSSLNLFSHVGTHLDLPFHFDEHGKKLDDYPASHWHFKNVCLLELPTQDDQIINLEEHAARIPVNCDLLLIKTDFEKFRQDERYWKHNPGLSPESGKFLKMNRPLVRCIGFDFISLTAFQFRELGRAAHREFLNSENAEAICIIEDMKLSNWHSAIKEVIVVPLLVEQADGTPVTVVAF